MDSPLSLLLSFLVSTVCLLVLCASIAQSTREAILNADGGVYCRTAELDGKVVKRCWKITELD